MNYKPINKYPSNWMIVLLILTITLSFNVFGALVVLASNYFNIPINEKFVQGTAQIIFLFGATLLLSKIIPLKFTTLFRLENNIEFKYILYGVFGLVFLNLFNTGFVSLQEHLIPDTLISYYNDYNRLMESLYQKMLGGDGIYEFLVAIVIGAVIPALSEEFLFRGFGQRALEEKNSATFAILVTGVIFGVIHFNFINIIPLMLIGFFLGYLAYYSKNLFVPIFIHFLNNVFSILMLYLGESESVTKDITLELIPAIIYTIIGLLGVIGLIIILSRSGNLKSE